MVGTDSLYRGSNDGFDAEKGTDFVGYHVPSGGFSMSTMPMTANQIKEVTGRINMGLKSVEMGVIQPKVMDAIPDSHLEEINRLSKLTGVDMTFHAPLVEPTGFSQNKGRWSELDRKQSEMQILNSIERSHKVKPDGNIIVTMHASQEFPMPETKVKTRRPDGSFEEKTQNIAVMDPFSGQIGSIPTIEKDYFKKDGGEISPQEVIDDMNKRAWTDELSSVIRTKSIAAQENRQVRELTKDKKFAEDPYTAYKRDPKETQNIINNFKNSNEVNDKETAHVMKMIIDSDRDKDMMMRNVYAHFKQMYNWAMDDAQRTDQKEEVNRLREFTKEARPLIEKYEKGEASLDAFSEQLDKGLDILSTLKKNPSKYIEAKEFAINKSAETFSNVALESYKKFGNTAPILSIENGPVGMGISTGENLKKLVDETRKKFVDNAQKSKDEGGLNMSKSSAEEQAEKLIGVTWDLGHINMLRGYGYGDKDLIKETKAVAKDIKHIHLSDNFGFEHTELPMGMGNVPTEGHLKAMKEYGTKMDGIKKVIEAGDWWQHFQTSPLVPTLEAFGSPVYGMKMAPYWNAAANTHGGYFAGYGMNPDVHHTLYGAGFSNLPVELGGQMSGRSRMSGNPME